MEESLDENEEQTQEQRQQEKRQAHYNGSPANIDNGLREEMIEDENRVTEEDFASVSNFDASEQGKCFEIVKHDAREIYHIVKAMAFREVCFFINTV